MPASELIGLIEEIKAMLIASLNTAKTNRDLGTVKHNKKH